MVGRVAYAGSHASLFPLRRESCLHFYERRTLQWKIRCVRISWAAGASDGCARDFNAPLGPHRERKGTLFDAAGAQMCRIKHLAHKTAWRGRRTWRRVCRCIIAQPSTNRRRPRFARTHTHTRARIIHRRRATLAWQHLTFIARRNHCWRGVIASWLFPLAAFCGEETRDIKGGKELGKSKGAGVLTALRMMLQNVSWFKVVCLFYAYNR